MFCVSCGHQISDGVAFCPMCGADNQSVSVNQEARLQTDHFAPTSNPAFDTDHKNPPRKRRWGILAAIGIVLIGVVTLVFALQPKRGEGKETTCDKCGNRDYCYSITYQDRTGWLCDSCYGTVEAIISAQYDLTKNSDGYSWETCDKCGIYTECTLYKQNGMYEWLCRYCD